MAKPKVTNDVLLEQIKVLQELFQEQVQSIGTKLENMEGKISSLTENNKDIHEEMEHMKTYLANCIQSADYNTTDRFTTDRFKTLGEYMESKESPGLRNAPGSSSIPMTSAELHDVLSKVRHLWWKDPTLSWGLLTDELQKHFPGVPKYCMKPYLTQIRTKIKRPRQNISGRFRSTMTNQNNLFKKPTKEDNIKLLKLMYVLTHTQQLINYGFHSMYVFAVDFRTCGAAPNFVRTTQARMQFEAIWKNCIPQHLQIECHTNGIMTFAIETFLTVVAFCFICDQGLCASFCATMV